MRGTPNIFCASTRPDWQAEGRRHFMFSTCPFVRSSVCYQTYERDILKTNEPILMPIGINDSRGKVVKR